MSGFGFLAAGSGAADAPGWEDVYAAAGQAECPVHHAPLSPVRAPAGRLAGYCMTCGKYWGINQPAMQTGWWAGRYPGPEPAQVPGWMDWTVT